MLFFRYYDCGWRATVRVLREKPGVQYVCQLTDSVRSHVRSTYSNAEGLLLIWNMMLTELTVLCSPTLERIRVQRGGTKGREYILLI